jgi:photosystem II stability/assembly factor-like uncharacterized protein
MNKLLIILLLLSKQALSQNLELKNIETNIDASFRGLSVVDDSVVWVSGSNGYVGKSTNGSHTWVFSQIKGFEKNDFRSIYAFNAKTAVIANAGSPAYILRTTDSGQNWTVVYTNKDSAAFFDGIDFWNNKEGMIYGDPIRHRMLLLRTHDGGQHWSELPKASCPELEQGESSFAASGTGIRCLKKNKIAITTGGKESRFFLSDDKGKTWTFVRSPINKGKASTGIFSFGCIDDTTFIVVGGDYKNETFSKDNVYLLYRNIDHFTWKVVFTPTRGYRECVEYLGKKKLVAVGPTGVDISYNGGLHWKPFSEEKGLHVIRKSRKGKLIIAAGAKGKICVLE